MEKEAIRAELKKVREDIKRLKKDFTSKRDVKEEHFSKGEEISSEINSLYETVKKIEEENNLEKINSELEEKKKEYEEFKEKLAHVEAEFKKYKTQKTPKQSQEKGSSKLISAEKAKKELKQLELKLQTQVLSLEKESQLSKEISHLKTIIENGPIGTTTSDDESSIEFKKVRKEFNTLKKKYINTEKKIRSLYKQIRLISKEKKKNYKRIDELRNIRKDAFESFRDIKKDYSNVGKELKDLFKKEEELLISLGEAPLQKKKVADSQIKKKQKEVEDMLLKKGATLTTEDLLAFQTRK